MDFREEDGKAVLVNPPSLSNISVLFLLVLSASLVPPPSPPDP